MAVIELAFTGAESERTVERVAWETFATAHPHEAAALNWRRFVAFVRRQTGEPWTTTEIRALLQETDGGDDGQT